MYIFVHWHFRFLFSEHFKRTFNILSFVKPSLTVSYLLINFSFFEFVPKVQTSNDNESYSLNFNPLILTACCSLHRKCMNITVDEGKGEWRCSNYRVLLSHSCSMIKWMDFPLFMDQSWAAALLKASVFVKIWNTFESSGKSLMTKHSRTKL